MPGNFNRDGSVDAADIVVWRKGLGTTYTPDDYTDWRANIGATLAGSGAALPSAAPLSSAVPEPASLALAAVGGLGLLVGGRRGPRRATNGSGWKA